MPLREPGEFLAAERAEEKRDPERYRRQRVTEVVDHIGEKHDRTRHNENRRLTTPAASLSTARLIETVLALA